MSDVWRFRCLVRFYQAQNEEKRNLLPSARVAFLRVDLIVDSDVHIDARHFYRHTQPILDIAPTATLTQILERPPPPGRLGSAPFMIGV